MNQATWKTKDGRHLRPDQMGNAHLINTVRMLKKRAETARQEVIHDAYSAMGCMQGEAAIDSIESHITGLERVSADEIAAEQYPVFIPMLEEIEKRSLSHLLL